MTIREYKEILAKVKDIPTTRVVVELHKPAKNNKEYPDNYCMKCFVLYPCIDIQAIKRELK